MTLRVYTRVVTVECEVLILKAGGGMLESGGTLRTEGYLWASQAVLVVKNLLTNAGDIRDMDVTSASGRSPGGGHGNPLQCFCLENTIVRGAG